MTMNPHSADLLIHPEWILTMEAPGETLRDRAVAVRDGRIVALPPVAELGAWEAGEHLRLPGHALLPGLVNTHGHAAMSLLRGFADDLPLMPWLQEHIWPAESAHVSREFVRDGTRLAAAEMLLSGTTTFSDMYFFPEEVAAVASATGLRCQVAGPVFDMPSAWGSGTDEYISKTLALHDACKSRERVSVAFGPHSPYMVTEAGLVKIATYAAELDMPVHIHLHETAAEVLSAVEANGERPIDTLHRLGLLGPRTQCVHMTDVGRQDIELLAQTGAHVVHCPHSNMKLASGTCPVSDLLEAGVNVALGSDGAASNNRLNLFGEMHSAALLAKLRGADPALLNACQTLQMATLGGARALGLDEQIGSIRTGKFADLIAVDLSGPATQPVYNVASQLVYACCGSEVTHSWVAGQALLRERELLTLDLADTLGRVDAWRARIQR
jgi:5-methylthioadenosine/S-adenosylhomocysteine deaminase